MASSNGSKSPPPGSERLFDYFFVSRRINTGKECRIDVLETFPKSSEDLLREHPRITAFCFPEASRDTALRTTRFTFTLTSEKGTWLYGFCLRVMGKMDCLCVLSPNPWFSLFYEVLGYAELQYAQGKRPTVIYSLYHHTIPPPGSRFPVETVDHRFCVTRPDDTFPLLDAGMLDFFGCFGVPAALELFAAVLEERRVLLIGDDLDMLTACAHALTAIIYPFQWTHPFVPVLPPSMLDALCSPTPFIMGAHTEVLKQVQQLPTEELVMGDIRSGRVTGLTDDKVALPNLGKLKDKIKEITEKRGRARTERCMDLLFAFVDFFVSIFGRVRAFETTTMTKGVEVPDIDDASFVESWSDQKKHCRFVTQFVRGQMYANWKHELFNPPLRRDVFAERAAVKYAELWPEYATLRGEKEKDGLFARIGRARDKLRKEIDKKLGDKNVRYSNNRLSVASTISIRDDSKDGSFTPQPPRSPREASPTGFPESCWLDERKPDSVVKVVDDFPGGFLKFHESLDPFSVYSDSNPYASRRQYSTSPVPSPARRPSMGLEKEFHVTKIDRWVGLMYMGSLITTVNEGSGAAKAGLTPGMRILKVNGVPLPNDSHVVKKHLDNAPTTFTITAVLPGAPHTPLSGDPLISSPTAICTDMEESGTSPISLGGRKHSEQRGQQQESPPGQAQPILASVTEVAVSPSPQPTSLTLDDLLNAPESSRSPPPPAPNGVSPAEKPGPRSTTWWA